MQLFDNHAISQRLQITLDVAYEKLLAISNAEWELKLSPEKWSKKEILGHLIDSAANNHIRFVRAQLADKEFTSFPYEQNFFVSSQDYQHQDIKNILNLWRSYNAHLVTVIGKADPEKLSVSCRVGNYEPVTLGFLMNDYVDHMNHHLKALIL